MEREDSQKVTLKSQCHWCFWLDDGIASLFDVDIENGLLGDFLGV